MTLRSRTLTFLVPARFRRVSAVLVALGLMAFLGATAQADLLTTTDGLVLEGTVEQLPNGWTRITTADGSVDFPKSAVASVRKGASPRAAFLAEAADIDPKDAVKQYRLALKAEEAGLDDLARTYLDQAERAAVKLRPPEARPANRSRGGDG